MKDFKKLAMEQTVLSPIMVGKKKLATEDILNKELTIVAFDFAPKFTKEGLPIIDDETGEVDTFGVVVFNEMPDCYYSVGTVFTKVCKAWAADTTPEAASAELAESGGVRVRFTSSKTRQGKNLTAVEIL